jgi:hypothetical protein
VPAGFSLLISLILSEGEHAQAGTTEQMALPADWKIVVMPRGLACDQPTQAKVTRFVFKKQVSGRENLVDIEGKDGLSGSAG